MPYRLIAFSSDGRRLAVSNYANDVLVVDMKAGNIVKRLRHSTYPTNINFISKRGYLVTGERGGLVHLWDSQSGREKIKIETQSVVNDVAFDPDGTILAIACGDQSARIWNVDDVREIARVIPDAVVRSIAIDPKLTRVAIAGGNSSRFGRQKALERQFCCVMANFSAQRT